MEVEELKITIPENHEIDWQESAKQEKIVFKKKDTKPRSWEEYCANHRGDYYFITTDSQVIGLGFIPAVKNPLDVNLGKNTLPTKELAEAFLTMMQLMSLRQDWIHKWSIDNGMTVDWKPDWKDHKQLKANIIYNGTGFDVIYFMDLKSRPLSFPTKEVAVDFMNTFEDLLEIAKPLL
jgi:hypothetical protein